MAQSNRGTKRRCGHCGAPFYDLDRSPIACPKCGQEFVPQVRLPSRSRSPAAVAPQPVEIEEIDRFAEDEVLVAETDDDEAAVDNTDTDEDGGEEDLSD